MARVRPTERGFDFLNDLQALFLADLKLAPARTGCVGHSAGEVLKR
jgi:hypothetical protein